MHCISHIIAWSQIYTMYDTNKVHIVFDKGVCRSGMYSSFSFYARLLTRTLCSPSPSRFFFSIKIKHLDFTWYNLVHLLINSNVTQYNVKKKRALMERLKNPRISKGALTTDEMEIY